MVRLHREFVLQLEQKVCRGSRLTPVMLLQTPLYLISAANVAPFWPIGLIDPAFVSISLQSECLTVCLCRQNPLNQLSFHTLHSQMGIRQSLSGAQPLRHSRAETNLMNSARLTSKARACATLHRLCLVAFVMVDQSIRHRAPFQRDFSAVKLSAQLGD